MANSFEFTLNGERVVVENASSTMTLLDFLRRRGLTGTKQGCAEGDCGACSLALVDTDAHGKKTFRAINSCIALLPMVAGREILTVEGLAKARDDEAPPTLEELHPVQRAMVTNNGSQCGFCTPGFVMSMFEGYYRPALQARAQISDQLCGNLCRCTGYRPIRDAMEVALEERAVRGSDEFHALLKRASGEVPSLDYQSGGQHFLRPKTLKDLLTLRDQHPDAWLVAGATEIGVYLNKKFQSFPFLISIEGVSELRRIRKVDGVFHVGGASTLTELEEALAGAIPAIDKMLLVFASRQIRNRATLAGNLVTASPIGDMAPVLLALDASVVLASVTGERTVLLHDFFTGYRKTVMAPNEIVRTILIPDPVAHAGITRRIESYKVSKRRELDISITAAAFCIETDASHMITSARLAYGGVAATPARATRTEGALVGNPWNEETLRAACEILATEFAPLSDVRSGKEYRQELVVSLFEKFFRGESSASQDLPLGYESPGAFDGGRRDVPDSHLLVHESAISHVTGAAQYVDDQAQRREMLEMWPLCSPHARARILKLDVSRARSMPGVALVLTASDIPGVNDVGAIRKDEVLLADKEIVFHGQMIAVVIAATYEAARLASAAIVVEYEPLDAILSIETAIEHSSFHTEPHTIRRGDVARALQSAAHRVDGRIEIGGQEHFYLETHAAFAERGDDGDVFVSSSTQHPSEIQAVVSHVLHIPRSRVVVEAPRMGGGFGGKETQGNAFAALAALATWKLGKPVRVMLDRDLDMMLTGKRHPFLADYEASFDSEGHIQALKATLVSDGGWALDLSASILDRALFHIDNSYFIPNLEVQGRVAKTNVVSHTAFRGFGGPQGMVVIEEVMDRIARALGLAPEVVRERNLYRGEGESRTTHYGQDVGDNRIEFMWGELKRASELDARRKEIKAFNQKSANIKRGIAMTPVKFGISFTASFLNQAGALVLIYCDGTVQVNHGGTEMGQGLYTKVLGITMRELGVSAEKVRVMKTRTDKVPNTSPTAASSGADLNGAAVKNACDTLRARLSDVAAALLSREHGVTIDKESLRFKAGRVFVEHDAAKFVPFERLVEAAYLRQVSLSTTGFYRTPDLHYDAQKGRGKPFHYFAYGTAVTEVEVDGASGMKRILRTDILQDVGESLNIGIDRGQVEGAYVQGLGWLTGEELKWDDKGKLLAHSASTYQIPAISDAPIDFRVALLPKAAQADTVHGSKAVGEPPLMLAISAREAIRDAIAAFGASPTRVDLPSPATHEAIFHAIRTIRRAST
ncbi:MAG: xanthine dehydrogenase molybdopterin binding subunit [Sandaracinaceae bacterium]|nr:xanthine dehydrogenase molybdopterin binding subunit [Sandaracinaceae bacterium]